jgi:EAL domain-containing protein (putative c-di-GMP-specific phosphodiesterase class I)
VQERPFEVRASIGIALYPEHGQDTNSLVQSADVAMYAAKKSHTEWAVYAADPDRLSPRRLSLVGELRRGIAGNQLLLHYQPKIDLRTMQLDGAEALARWQHPREGLIPPKNFIPLAERTGLIGPLSLWTLEAALQQCQAWHEADLPLPVAVNLAPENLRDEQLVETMVRLLELVGAPPSWLTVEMTEGALMTNPAAAKSVLSRVHEIGVKIAIDDFGTGYSSLGHLKELPVDEVKVDQTFVKDMAVDKQDARIVRSVIDLGHDLGMRVVAEGVEGQASLDLLASWGCDFAQGFYFTRPLPAPDFIAWMVSANKSCNLGSNGLHPLNGHSETSAR